MPRWKALPEELDPEIREFASQMRQLVDRGGLSLAALSDQTGYSKTSWERYLNGRLLPPQGAVSALAQATGTDVRHLATMWELAERAWSRAEMRHDMTMEAIRISQAREALARAGEGGKGKKRSRGGDRPPKAKPEKVRFGKAEKAAKPATDEAVAEAPPRKPAGPPAPPVGVQPAVRDPHAGHGQSAGAPAARKSASSSDENPWPKVAASAPGPDSARAEATVRISRTTEPGPPEKPTASDEPTASDDPKASDEPKTSDEPTAPDARPEAGSQGGLSLERTGPADLRKRPGRPEWPEDWPTPADDEYGDRAKGVDVKDVGLADATEGPPRPEWSARLSGVPATPPGDFERTTTLRRQLGESDVASPATPYAGGAGTFGAGAGAGAAVPPGPPAPSTAAKPPSRGGRVSMMLLGAVGALAVVGAAVFFLDLGGQSTAAPEPTTSPSAESPKLPEGVKCSGADCAGEDPELMGCGGQYAETTTDAMVGNAYVEIRYSKVCKAAWARVSNATPGTTVTVEEADATEQDEVTDSNSGYTRMVAAKSAESAVACVETAGGLTGCTVPSTP